MKTTSRLHKIRIIVPGKSKSCYGLTIPEQFKQWFDCHVSITEENGKLVLTSGSIPVPLSNKELKQHSVEVTKLKL